MLDYEPRRVEFQVVAPASQAAGCLPPWTVGCAQTESCAPEGIAEHANLAAFSAVQPLFHAVDRVNMALQGFQPEVQPFRRLPLRQLQQHSGRALRSCHSQAAGLVAVVWVLQVIHSLYVLGAEGHAVLLLAAPP